MDELFKDNPGLRRYAEAITNEFNKWAVAHDEASRDFDLVNEGIAAFMCNAISTRILNHQHEDVRRYFHLYAL